MTIGDKIRAARESKGWVQEDLAKEMGVEPPTVSRWETGENRPHPKHVAKLTRVLNLPPGWNQVDYSEAAKLDMEAREKLAQKIDSLEVRMKQLNSPTTMGLFLPKDIIAMLSILNQEQTNSLRTYLQASIPSTLLDVLSALKQEQLGTVESFARKLLNSTAKPLKRRKSLG